MKLPSLALCLFLAACAAELDTETARQDLSTDVPVLSNATAAFTGAVASAVRDAAGARGLAVSPSAVRAGYSRRNTLGGAPSGASQLVLVGTPFVAGQATFGAGLYQLSSTRDGVMLYRLDPTGPTLLGPVGPPQQSVDVLDACYGAPSLLQEYCRSFAGCALYDWNCPTMPGYTYAG